MTPASPTLTRVTRTEDAECLCTAELEAWRGLLKVHACVMKTLDAELEAAHGLPLTSYEVLIHLGEAPHQKMRMCDLANRVHLSRSGMSRLVDRLERDELIERAACDADARGAYAVITARGLAVLEAARPTHLAGIRRRFLAHFSEDELRQLVAWWDRLLPSS
jgi:DNA-binding MarR family transcriptional regulator